MFYDNNLLNSSLFKVNSSSKRQSVNAIKASKIPTMSCWSAVSVNRSWKRAAYLIGNNPPGINLPIFEKGGKFLLGNLKHGQVLKWTQISKIQEEAEEELDSDDDDDRDLVIPLIHNHNI